MSSYKIQRMDALDYRPGWDVTCNLTDDLGRTCNLTFYWPDKEKPDAAILDKQLQHVLANWIIEAVEVFDTQVSKKEIEALLVGKSLLKPGETLEQLKTLSELTAEVK